jgi:hypothetical protein
VPKPLKQAMLLLIGVWYDNREAIVFGNPIEMPAPASVARLISLYKTWRAA